MTPVQRQLLLDKIKRNIEVVDATNIIDERKNQLRNLLRNLTYWIRDSESAGRFIEAKRIMETINELYKEEMNALKNQTY